MTLTPEQLHRLRMEDGIVADDRGVVAGDLVFDAQADAEFRTQLRDVLLPTTVPSLVVPVMARIAAGGIPVGDAVRDEADDEVILSRAVMGNLGFGSDFNEQYRNALKVEAGDFSSVWPGVAAAIGVEVGTSIGDMLRQAVESEAAYEELIGDTAKQASWQLPTVAGVLVAAAAALLLWVGSSGTTAKDVAEKIAEGPIQIEHLDVGSASAVQVLQLGEDAPTIILLKESGEQKGEVE